MTNRPSVAYATGLMPQKRPETRKRKTVQVQLNTQKHDEAYVLKLVEALKPVRAFKETFTRAMEVIAGIEVGNFNPLIRWYGSQLADYVNAQLDARFSRIEAHMLTLQKQIDEMNRDRERMGLQRVEIPPAPPIPTFTIEKSTDSNPSKNFLKALGAKK